MVASPSAGGGDVCGVERRRNDRGAYPDVYSSELSGIGGRLGEGRKGGGHTWIKLVRHYKNSSDKEVPSPSRPFITGLVSVRLIPFLACSLQGSLSADCVSSHSKSSMWYVSTINPRRDDMTEPTEFDDHQDKEVGVTEPDWVTKDVRELLARDSDLEVVAAIRKDAMDPAGTYVSDPDELPLTTTVENFKGRITVQLNGLVTLTKLARPRAGEPKVEMPEHAVRTRLNFFL